MEEHGASASPPPQDEASLARHLSPQPLNPGSVAHALPQTSLPQSHHHHIAQYSHVTDPALLDRDIIDRSLIDSTLTASTTTDFPIDPALGGVLAEHHQQLPVSTVDHIHNMSSTAYRMPSQPIIPNETQAIGPSHNEEPQPGPSKKPSIVEDSDQELKRLAAENQSIPLKELATRVRTDENGPQAEKSRQIFGMRWLLASCELAADASVAVPRNRVYARYVGMCANERIKPLNPASFGKLVRLMYPDIKTRRLGVRGHSKYHYCGIKLKGDHTSPNPKASQGSASGSEPPPQMSMEDHLHVTPNGSIPTFGNASFLNENGFLPSNPTPPKSPDISPVAKFLQEDIYFMPYDFDDFSSPNKHIILPDIAPYAPPNVDPDVSASLAAIYRSHCTSLVECVRYMRLKQFFALFVSFQGTLTAPVQKLFCEPSIAAWILESDWSTYKHMIRLLSPLALQVVPAAVMAGLRQFSTNLTSQITTTFSNQPQHVLDAKSIPSSIFSSLLDRLLRVNEAAHAAARILVHAPDRTLMRQDWRKYVNCKSIVEREVPCSSAAVLRILEDEILSLLQPEPDELHPGETSPSPGSEEEVALATTESVLDRWTQFLASLPLRFPHTPPRLFLLCVGAVASAALRDMTMAGGESFGGWWVVRCWIDEWIGWTAERGGFLRHGEEYPTKAALSMNGGRLSVDGGTVDGEDELGPDDSGVSLREEGISPEEANGHKSMESTGADIDLHL